jgi:regulator of protease activity HflC (stomatin/prohibitin superfamily)
MTLYVLVTLLIAGLVLLGSSVRVVTQFERGVVLRFGRLSGAVRAPA